MTDQRQQSDGNQTRKNDGRINEGKMRSITGFPSRRSPKLLKADNDAMDEDNPDLNWIQVEEKFNAKKEIWAHFYEKYGWTFDDWVEMTQNWKDISKARRRCIIRECAMEEAREQNWKVNFTCSVDDEMRLPCRG